MGRSVVYCPICGCPFEDISSEETSDFFDSRILPPEETEWLAQFRVMGRSSFTGEQEQPNPQFSISASAHEAEFRCVTIENTPSKNSAWTCWNGLKWKVFERNDAGVVLYPIHDACIEAMKQVTHQRSMCELLSHLMTPSHGSLEGCYEALLRLHERTTEYPYGTDIEEEVAKHTAYPSEYGQFKLEWEHQYYGAARFAEGSSWDMFEAGWEWICADPITIKGLTSWVLNQVQPILEPPRPSTISSLPPPTSQINQSLESLPTEIIAKITSFLSALAVLRVRRCSKTLAFKISINQSFWRDHLIHGDLVDYLWDLDSTACYKKDKEGNWNWMALVQALLQPKILKSALGASLKSDEVMTFFEQMSLKETDFADAPIGLQNRCRIVRIVRDIEKLDKIEAEEPIVDGEKVRHFGLLFS